MEIIDSRRNNIDVQRGCKSNDMPLLASRFKGYIFVTAWRSDLELMIVFTLSSRKINLWYLG